MGDQNLCSCPSVTCPSVTKIIYFFVSHKKFWGEIAGIN